MHRLFPACLVLMVFTAFLVAQVVLDKWDTKATLSSGQQRKTTLYKDNLRSLKGLSFDGKEIDLSKNRAPVVILNFWASWCAPCLEEFPSLVQLRKKYGEDKVLIVGINDDMEDINKSVAKIYREYRLNFPSIVPGNPWIQKFKIKSIPISIIYLGDEVMVSEGAQDFMDSKFLAMIDRALKGS